MTQSSLASVRQQTTVFKNCFRADFQNYTEIKCRSMLIGRGNVKTSSTQMERESATSRDEFHRAAFHQRVWRHFYFRHFADLLFEASRIGEEGSPPFLRHTLGVAQSRIISRSRNSAKTSTRNEPRPGSFVRSLCVVQGDHFVWIGILTRDRNLSMELVKQRRVHFSFHVFFSDHA